MFKFANFIQKWKFIVDVVTDTGAHRKLFKKPAAIGYLEDFGILKLQCLSHLR